MFDKANGMFSAPSNSTGMFEGALGDDATIAPLVTMMQNRGNAVTTATTQTGLNAARLRLYEALVQAGDRIAVGQGGASAAEWASLRDTYTRKLYTYTSTANTTIWEGEGTVVQTTGGGSTGGSATASSGGTSTGSSGKLAPTQVTAGGSTVNTASILPSLSLNNLGSSPFFWIGLAGLAVGGYLYYKDKK